LSSNSDILLPINLSKELGQQTQQQLPDLVCDIGTNALVEMSDSLRTATQSTSTTDDEMPPFDEYMDARSDIVENGGERRPSLNPAVDFASEAPWLVETRGGTEFLPDYRIYASFFPGNLFFEWVRDEEFIRGFLKPLCFLPYGLDREIIRGENDAEIRYLVRDA
jgi:hypothetical protein